MLPDYLAACDISEYFDNQNDFYHIDRGLQRGLSSGLPLQKTIVLEEKQKKDVFPFLYESAKQSPQD